MPPSDTESKRFPTMAAVLSGNDVERGTALAHIIAAHWKPLYKYVRLQYRIPAPEACTVTQNFLESLQGAEFFTRFDFAGLSLREFIRQELDAFVRIPGARKTADINPSLDFTGAEDEFNVDQTGPGQRPAEYYNSEWVRSLLTLAVEELHTLLTEEGKSTDFSLFMKLDLQDRSGTERVGLEEIASALSMTLSGALESLARTRQRFQNILMDLIRSFTSSDAEFRREARAFFQA
jgi:hypothetical protein